MCQFWPRVRDLPTGKFGKNVNVQQMCQRAQGKPQARVLDTKSSMSPRAKASLLRAQQEIHVEVASSNSWMTAASNETGVKKAAESTVTASF